MKFPQGATLAALILLAAAPSRASLGYAWTRIADTTMNRPDGTLFTPFDLRGGALAGSQVFFTDQSSVFLWANGSITCVITNGTVYPEVDADPIVIDRLTTFRAMGENHVIVAAWLTNGTPICITYRDGRVYRTVSTNVVIEGSQDHPPTAYACTTVGDRTTFLVEYPKPNALHPEIPVPPHPDGWYVAESNVARRLIGPGDVVADTGQTITMIPSLQMGSATSWFFTYYSSNTMMTGFGLLETGHVTTILKTGDVLPGTPRFFRNAGRMSARNGEVAFIAQDNSLRGDLYAYADHTLSLLVPRETMVPPSTDEAVGAFNEVVYDGGNLTVDLAGERGSAGVYLYTGGALEKVIALGDLIGTQRVTSTSMGHDLDGNSVCVRLVFEDGNHAIYRGEAVFENMTPVDGDYDGDSTTDTAFYDQDRDTWYVRSKDRRFKTYRFGYGPTLPAAGDFDGDGRTDRAVYDPNNGSWYTMRSRDGFAVHQFGYGGTQPIQADFDGDGITDRAVYDPRNSWWYIMGSREGFITQQFGYGGTTPLAADFDGDGKADFGAYERDTGWWYILSRRGVFTKKQFGYPGVTPVIADFDGGGADFVVFDRAIGRWYILGQRAGFSVRDFGYRGVLPLTADFDGDRRTDIGVYDPKRAFWYLLRTSSGFRASGF